LWQSVEPERFKREKNVWKKILKTCEKETILKSFSRFLINFSYYILKVKSLNDCYTSVGLTGGLKHQHLNNPIQKWSDLLTKPIQCKRRWANLAAMSAKKQFEEKQA